MVQPITKEERDAKQTAFAIISGEYPDKVDACRNLLEVISKRTGTPSLQNDPALQFAYFQVHLATNEMLSKFNNQNISHIEIRQNVENLCQLFTLFLIDRGYICVPFANSMQHLCMAVCEVCNLLEKKCKGKYINWPDVGRNFVIQAQNADAKEKTSFMAYVPKLEDFKQGCRIGAGRFSEVYLVTQESSGHAFAMKISPRSKFNDDANTDSCDPMSESEPVRSSPENTLSFVDKMFGALTHDHLVCRIFCTFQAEPDVDITLMEVGENDVDVLRIIENVGYLTTVDALLIALQVILALEHIHLRGFIHRDVRPSNFVVDGYGKLRLVDFDSAKVCRGHFGSDVVFTDYFKRTALEFKDKEIVGNVAYTAPEVLQKKGWGRACDWWSLGVSIYKMTTGRLPFRGASPAAVIESVCNDELKWPKFEDLPHSAIPEIKEFVYDLLKKNPRQRLGSKIYSDLHERAAVEQAKRLLRKVQTIKGSNLTVRGKLCVIAFSEMDRNITKDLKAPVAQIVAERPAYGVYRLSDLSDRTEDITPLMNFSHPKYRRFMDRLSGNLPQSDKFLVPITPPPDKELDYCQRYDPETFIGFTWQPTAVQRKSQIQLADVTFRYKTKCFCFKTPNIKLRLARGEGKLTYPVVYAKKNTSSEHHPDEATYGDILVQIGKTSVVGVSLDKVSSTLKHYMNEAEGKIKCQVLMNNIFRLAHVDRDGSTALKLLTNSPEVEATLTSPKSKYVQTHFLKIYNAEAKCFEGFHTVSLVYPDVSPSENDPMIFFGDVVTHVDGRNVSQADPIEVERLCENRASIRIGFYQTSVLRRKDLHEAGIEAMDVADGDLEAMTV